MVFDRRDKTIETPSSSTTRDHRVSPLPQSRQGLPAYQAHEVGLPQSCGMPALITPDFGALERQSLLDSLFRPSPSSDDRYEPFRSFLIFRMTKAARNYAMARAAVLAQIDESKRWETDVSGGQGLPILQFAGAFDDCLSDLFAVGRTIRRMDKHGLANGSLQVSSAARIDARYCRSHAQRERSYGQDDRRTKMARGTCAAVYFEKRHPWAGGAHLDRSCAARPASRRAVRGAANHI